jgi:transcriptional regulator of arginine metabolism
MNNMTIESESAHLTQPKTKRQRAILSLIAARPVRSQDELAMLLELQGYDVTQATISRDIKELGLMKVPLKGATGGQFKYVEPSVGPTFTSRLHRIVAELVLSVRGSVNQIVLRTPPGGAMMLASAIDSAGWGEVIGTLGGDDTVLVICEKAEAMPMVMQRFEDMRTEIE